MRKKIRKEGNGNVGQVEEMKNFRSEIERYYLPITVFITGAVILVLEILGTRIIAPYYGTTIYVWSSLIGVTLIALASGYFLGGWIADKIPRIDIVYLIIFIAAISIIVIPIITNFVLVKTNVLGARYGALTSACILFTIPLILLGTIVPYVIKLKTKELGKIGITAGSLYSIATIGSFFGAIITGFYLIPNIGINSIVYLSSGLLLLLSLFWFIVHGKKTLSVSTISFIAVIILVIFTGSSITKPMPNEDIEIIYEEESPYSRLKVIDEDESRYLIINGALQTIYRPEYKRFTFTYLKLFENAVKYHSNPKDVLVIGLGGGGVDRQLEQYNLNIDNVEIDPEIAKIARNYFDFEGKVITDDGRHHIRNTSKKYDIVFLDVYGGYSIYSYLFSEEAFIEIKDVLNENGILVINAIGYEMGHHCSEDDLIVAIYKTLGEVFPNVYVKSTGTGLTNIVFYASDSALELDNEFISINVTPTENTPIITDDYNPIEMFSIKAAEEFRNQVIGWLGNGIL